MAAEPPRRSAGAAETSAGSRSVLECDRNRAATCRRPAAHGAGAANGAANGTTSSSSGAPDWRGDPIPEKARGICPARLRSCVGSCYHHSPRAASQNGGRRETCRRPPAALELRARARARDGRQARTAGNARAGGASEGDDASGMATPPRRRPINAHRYMPIHTINAHQYIPIHTINAHQYKPIHTINTHRYIPIHTINAHRYIPIHTINTHRYIPIHTINAHEYIPIHTINTYHRRLRRRRRLRDGDAASSSSQSSSCPPSEAGTRLQSLFCTRSREPPENATRL